MPASRLLVTCPLPDAVIERAAQEFGATLSQDTTLTPREMLDRLAQQPVEAVLLSSRTKLDAATIAGLPPDVRIVATCSVGYDHIDLVAATARRIVITNTPEVLTNATADLTMLLILAACRRAADYYAIMRAGWRHRHQLNEMLGVEVSGKRLGIFGMGRIGRAVASRARGFGMEILYTDVQRLPPELEQGATYYPSLHEMLPQCQILTLHAPGGPQTDNIMDARAIALLPRGAVLVNAARGQLVDEEALIDALRFGHLFAAGLDVYRKEPDFDLRLRDMPNVFLTPHMGSATIETRTAMGMRALDNIAAVLSSQRPIDPVLVH
jgi:lactate dehydrogenase-like 2-hydroxyacid dehydrogenase